MLGKLVNGFIGITGWGCGSLSVCFLCRVGGLSVVILVAVAFWAADWACAGRGCRSSW